MSAAVAVGGLVGPVAGLAGPFGWVARMLSHPFLARAFEAGTLIAAACGVIGYFLVLRTQVFTGEALSHVAFTGAVGALVVGVDLRLGLFLACVAFAVGVGLLGERGGADDVVIGSTLAWVLGLGVLFLSLYATSASAANGTAGVTVLFGSIFGLSSEQVAVAALVAVGVLAATSAVGRPLLLASIDEAVAAAAGVPVRAVGVGFLVLLGVTAGEATQAVGALLLVGLLAAPAAAAQRLCTRPWPTVALAAGLAVLSMWAGLTLSYAVPTLPPSFAIVAAATALYLGVIGWRRWQGQRARTRPFR